MNAGLPARKYRRPRYPGSIGKQRTAGDPTHPRRIAPAHPGAPASNGVDLALTESLRRGNEATAELAAIPDTPELERADEAILRAKGSTPTAGRTASEKKLRGWRSYTVVVGTG